MTQKLIITEINYYSARGFKHDFEGVSYGWWCTESCF